ncbi:replication initiation protein RepC [Mesorhizobium microcysteis]|uniref:Replication initiation protein RepC n=1 Tax=Neoaquamicrobium microcysteis TaxID=2682781 RepID=A0A5D4H7S7_9HYPH|nr:plasmid replication protein RepC [Mesorhizobium microcysteis]TYR37141.1 replication initiation protein RepC [Mesorhizobium microcysteis]
MMDRFATTPFGGGRVRAADFRRRETIDRRRAALNAGGNDTGKADKWQLIRALSEARAVFGLSDRAIAVLEALLSFHQARELDGSEPIVVFPSNAELSLRSRGMADATLRRHIAALVEAGLILRRDSPNGKRYCRRNDQGGVESAFGFDLSPLALAATAIHDAAEDARAHARHCQKLRAEIGVHLRDTGKIIEAGLAEGREGDWEAYALTLVPLARRLSRQASQEALTNRRDDLVRLRAQVEKAYLDSLTEQEMSGNDVDSERHYQNSNTDQHFEYSSEKELKQESDRVPVKATEPGDPTGQGEAEKRAPASRSEPVPLSYLLAVCPTLASYARDGISSWQDVMATAGLVRSMLGISPDAWRRACEAMGEIAAAVTVAAILERADTIRSPGGYLRALTERAEKGQFSIRPMLSALENG